MLSDSRNNFYARIRTEGSIQKLADSNEFTEALSRYDHNAGWIYKLHLDSKDNLYLHCQNGEFVKHADSDKFTKIDLPSINKIVQIPNKIYQSLQELIYK